MACRSTRAPKAAESRPSCALHAASTKCRPQWPRAPIAAFMTAPTDARKKVFIRSYGCQMNVYDSGRMADVLARDYAPTDVPDDADLILLNTCHIRERASE